MQIELRDVSYSYNHGHPGEVQALKGVNTLIRSGEVLAILGREGSGKSTLLQHLNGLLQPTDGLVLADGAPLTAQAAVLLRARVALVFQYPEHQLFAPTVFDDIAFALRRQSLGESELEERVRDAAALAGLDLSTLRSRRPLELSSGERRRVAIAGALAVRPTILLLDEPMAGLDPMARRNFSTTLKQLQALAGMGIVFVSHSLEQVLPVADRIMVMDRGLAVFDGTPSTLLREREDLARWGLRLPAAVRFLDMLRNQGMEVPPELWRIPDVVAAVERAKEGHLGVLLSLAAQGRENDVKR